MFDSIKKRPFKNLPFAELIVFPVTGKWRIPLSTGLGSFLYQVTSAKKPCVVHLVVFARVISDMLTSKPDRTWDIVLFGS